MTALPTARTPAVMRVFAVLRWRLLRGAIRRGGADQVGTIVSIVLSAIVGGGLAIAAAALGRTHVEASPLTVIFCSVTVLAVAGFGVVSGINQAIDPRVLAAEPITDNQRALGLLAAAASGPTGLAGVAIGAGLAVGAVDGAWSLPIVLAGVLSWLASLLFLARTATNLLALLISRAPRLGQVGAGLFGLAFYGAFQFIPAAIGDIDRSQRADLASWLSWTPPGRTGRSIADAATDPLGALVDLVIGSLWLVPLAVGYLGSARRLAAATRRASAADGELAARSPVAAFVRRACGSGPCGAIAWRSILTRLRTPRSALETVTGAGIGMAAVLVPALATDAAGSGSVLVGGAVQLAVLFMSGNSLGTDGPAVTHELLAGVGLPDLVRGKARSIAIVAAPLAVIGPLLAAALTGEWRFLVAGFGVGIGGLLAGTGAAIAQSALVPIAMPESDNPFVSGDSGKGIIAALLLVGVMAAIAVTTLPVALALLWAIDRGNVGWVTVLGGATVGAGWLVLRAGVWVATRRLADRQPEFVTAVTPTR